jgi:hypothetical protein
VIEQPRVVAFRAVVAAVMANPGEVVSGAMIVDWSAGGGWCGDRPAITGRVRRDPDAEGNSAERFRVLLTTFIS